MLGGLVLGGLVLGGLVLGVTVIWLALVGVLPVGVNELRQAAAPNPTAISTAAAPRAGRSIAAGATGSRSACAGLR